MYGVPDEPQRLTLRLLRSRTQARQLLRQFHRGQILSTCRALI
ncbi:hypothetical protein PGR6_32300 [Pseudomonas sp. GR 6-02]|jgi:hypothetical protein|nr:hypothetical protein PGR6_32300 [Pseudomonas sp. GR 6-02]